MLVGVGASGKQSLCRLAAYMSEFDVKIPITSNNGVKDLKGRCAGQTNCVPDDRLSNCQREFLVYINGMITGGWIPDLFPKEDLENILGSIANEAKSVGIPDNPEARTNFFVSKVKKNLHVSLRSPPWGIHSEFELDDSQASFNNTVIDQFQT
jgi:dynein heavy chain